MIVGFFAFVFYGNLIKLVLANTSYSMYNKDIGKVRFKGVYTMSKYSEFLKSVKESHLTKFFGEVKHTSNKYFKFNHVISDDEIIIVTNNVKFVKGNPVLIIDNNKVVYLKDWNVAEVRNYNMDLYAYAVKLNRIYWKEYTFKSDFEDMCFKEADTFDRLKAVAEMQNDTEIALGWGK